MKELLLKIALIFLICFLIILGKLLPNLIHDILFQNIPYNNIANNNCFKAKVDHLIYSQNFKNCSFLIAGSSISMNNISGEIIKSRFTDTVYNFSAFNMKISQLIDLLKFAKPPKTKFILVAFNNWDFGKPLWSYDIKATNKFINGNALSRTWVFVKKFNVNTFSEDWDSRIKYSNIRNNYLSLNFDKYGSVLMDSTGFIINTKRWDETRDTSGFEIFRKDVIRFKAFCSEHELQFKFVYMPYRPGKLSDKAKELNKQLASILKKELKDSFLDLQNCYIPVNFYCDECHMFKQGSEMISNIIADSLSQNNLIRHALHANILQGKSTF